MNNISEGFESRTVNRFINYLGQAKASCGETRSMLYVAKDCKYIDEKHFEKLTNLCFILSRKIRSLMTYLEDYDSNNRISEINIDYETDR